MGFLRVSLGAFQSWLARIVTFFSRGRVMCSVKAVAVASVKGGCGKTMISLNLAFELKGRGLRVGFLDADIDSPYGSEVLRLEGKVGLDKDRRMVPVDHMGLKVMSFAAWAPSGFGGTTMHGEAHEVWLRDAIKETDWSGVDVLVIDAPAGSGDELLSIVDALGKDLVGLVAVGLPSAVSGLRRVFDAASYHRLRILGVVENMAGDVFGRGSVGLFCNEHELRFFGSIPLAREIRERQEAGEPRLPVEFAGPIVDAAAVVEKALGWGGRSS